MHSDRGYIACAAGKRDGDLARFAMRFAIVALCGASAARGPWAPWTCVMQQVFRVSSRSSKSKFNCHWAPGSPPFIH